MPLEEVPGIQKRMIRMARDAGKPIIVATQMLESMISAPMPTRAEASDVATAVFDGTDAVMLSAETASGQYPIEAVEFMDRALRKVEHDALYRSILHSTQIKHPRADFIMTAAAVTVAEQLNAAAIVTFTALGATTLRASRERPSAPILCMTPTTKRGRQLVLSYGVSVFLTELGSFDDFAPKACEIAKAAGVASPGSHLVITAGVPLGVPGSTNVMRICVVE
jgi:pyruvate kinase